ncbi:hypothetical protein HPB47_025632, partial [Ixodes persulcatus]
MKDLESHKVDPLHGLDSRWSWITAASCSWILFFATFSVRVTGVLFIGIMGTFGVTREQASWPVTLHSCFLHLGGPVMGLLCRRFSCRKVLLVCTSLTGPATALCFFAEGVLFINIFFGVLHGHFRDKLQEYNGLLHVVAVANVLLLAIWTLRM